MTFLTWLPLYALALTLSAIASAGDVPIDIQRRCLRDQIMPQKAAYREFRRFVEQELTPAFEAQMRCLERIRDEMPAEIRKLVAEFDELRAAHPFGVHAPRSKKRHEAGAALLKYVERVTRAFNYMNKKTLVYGRAWIAVDGDPHFIVAIETGFTQQGVVLYIELDVDNAEISGETLDDALMMGMSSYDYEKIGQKMRIALNQTEAEWVYDRISEKCRGEP